MRLARPDRSRTLISIVSMIDVLMILLVFFMVTSTYLDLGMMPMAERGKDPGQSDQQTTVTTGHETVLIRIGPDGIPRLRGQQLSPEELAVALGELTALDPAIQVLVLPSGAAQAQALVGILDAAARAGITRLQVVRLDGSP